MELAWHWRGTGVALVWYWRVAGAKLALDWRITYMFRTSVLQERKRHGTGGAGMELAWNWRGTVVGM